MQAWRLGSAIVVALLAWTSGLTAQQTLTLDNGDRFSGTVTRIDGATWIFRHSAGEAKVPARRIAGFRAPEPIGVRLADGTVAAVTVRPAGHSLRVTLSDGSSRVVAPTGIQTIGSPDQLEALEPLRIGIFSPVGMFWGASGSLGFSENSGNSRSRGIGADLEVSRRAPKDRITLGLGLYRGLRPDDDGELVTAVSKYHGSFRLDVYFDPRFFVFGATLQERDRFQDIDLRSNYSGGLGWQTVGAAATDWRLSLSSGVRVKYFVENGRETVAVVNAGSELKQQLGFATIDWTINWTGSVKEATDYRFRSNATVTADVYRGLGFRIGLLNEFNNRPRPEREKHDMLLTTRLAYSTGMLR